MISEELLEILKNKIQSYKFSIEKIVDTEEYLVGVLLNGNSIHYNSSSKIAYKKHQVLDVIHNILKMKYSIDFRYSNLDSEDPIYRVIAEYHHGRDTWNCPVEYLYTVKKLTENKLLIKDFKDIEDLFII